MNSVNQLHWCHWRQIWVLSTRCLSALVYCLHWKRQLLNIQQKKKLWFQGHSAHPHVEACYKAARSDWSEGNKVFAESSATTSSDLCLRGWLIMKHQAKWPLPLSWIPVLNLNRPLANSLVCWLDWNRLLERTHYSILGLKQTRYWILVLERTKLNSLN